MLLALTGILPIAVVAIVLGLIAPVAVGAGLLTAGLVLFDPAGLGERLRLSPGWWGIPGLRRASGAAAPFAAALLAYTVPLPAAGFALIHLVSGSSRTPSSQPVSPPAPSQTPTPSPVLSVSATPTSSASATPAATKTAAATAAPSEPASPLVTQAPIHRPSPTPRSSPSPTAKASASATPRQTPTFIVVTPTPTATQP